MIVSTGLRTDIVCHYADWLFARFREGLVLTRNPLFPNKVTRYRLTPDKVDAVLFRSKDYSPVLSRLHEITNRFHTFFHYSLTAYENDLEPNIPDVESRVRTLIELSSLVGRQRILWRFDPVLFTPKYTAEALLDAFDRLAERIAPHVCGCSFGFLEPFFQLRSRVPDLLSVDVEEKKAFAKRLAAIAARHDLPLQTCGSKNTYEAMGIVSRGCATLDEIGRANGCCFRSANHTGNHRGCLCYPSRDLGWYDSCPSGCRYCSNIRNAAAVRENFLRNDPASPLLIGVPERGDDILDGVQTSLLRDEKQISLFDL